MQPFYNESEIIKYNYKMQLRKSSNTAGVILNIYMLVMFGLSFVTILIPTILSVLNNGTDSYLDSFSFMNDTTFIFIESGFVSLVAFFGVAILYTLISKSSLKETYPTQKVGFKNMYLICTFGLAIALTANYASNILLGLFDFAGVDATIDMEYECTSVLDILLYYITVAVLPALVEEFAFRGVILSIFKRYSDGLAVLISGISFGLMHGNFTQIPFALIVGFVLAFITIKTNSIIPAIIIHFLNNGLSVTISLLGSQTNLSDTYVTLVNVLLTALVAILGILSFIIISKKFDAFFKLNKNDDVLTFKEKVKTVISSPSIIIFAVFMMLEAVMMLFLEV